MFQQFKNIFPNTTLNLRSSSQSEGSSEPEWKARGLERLETLKSEFQQWNDILLQRNSTILPHLSPSLIPSPTSSQPTQPTQPPLTDLEATTQLLQKVQKNWETVRTNHRDSIEKSNEANKRLQHLTAQCDAHVRISQAMEQTSQEAALVQSQLDQLASIATRLTQTLQSLETQIDLAEKDSEKAALEQWKTQQETLLAAERAAKQQELDRKEAVLKEKFEKHSQQQKQERVALYDATFQAELEAYRQRRETHVSSLYSVNTTQSDQMTTTLETLKLDQEDTGDLHDFLGEDAASREVKITPADEPEKKVTKDSKKRVLNKKKPKKPKRIVESESSSEGERIEILGDEDYEE
ncbi:hypothetical protein J3Q64DRAFT_1832818 [Phycomyces blakesleeanus]|uniref:Uncharacterized protein n=2 Tax=Phycomyces blakesleeanus TaxID=4837 RepID=A0A162PQ80_PHYB8|nr:hypothetical protein PHYBLDRAFT_146876 [Phycomyces blakesleeanus NRRL 1555(-)]OAD71896.1 hypothetical protein PHYBLDRAFT_146876 [Phycomyces blakesleeanus NRRL 1555(-)]|eukprot:XP_018289936.1 hypothetical protein PHYBLDRAFT_146876 [Phycomyces blakesleeanus NRRL 1555(-)]